MSQPDTPCSLCRGACCESLMFPAMPSSKEYDEFLRARGKIAEDGFLIEIEARCPHLRAPCGSCGIYSERPTVCRNYIVGSPICLATISARRPGAWGKAILAAINTTQEKTVDDSSQS